MLKVDVECGAGGMFVAAAPSSIAISKTAVLAVAAVLEVVVEDGAAARHMPPVSHIQPSPKHIALVGMLTCDIETFRFWLG